VVKVDTLKKSAFVNFDSLTEVVRDAELGERKPVRASRANSKKNAHATPMTMYKHTPPITRSDEALRARSTSESIATATTTR
jgi:hypothetical protein